MRFLFSDFMPSLSKFLDSWVDPKLHPEYADVFAKVMGKPSSAFCKVCRKEFILSNMGVQALKSHIKSKGHVSAYSMQTNHSKLSFFVKRPTSTSEKPSTSTCTSKSVSKPSEQEKSNETTRQDQHANFYKSDHVNKAEILWCLNVVNKGMSLRTCDGVQDLFRSMFPDSEVAKVFSMGRDKVGYTIAFGLFPAFKKELVDNISDVDDLSLCFDEALNRIAQRCQLDLIVKYWCPNSNAVTTRYLTSVFVDRATASNLATAIKDGLGSIK